MALQSASGLAANDERQPLAESYCVSIHISDFDNNRIVSWIPGAATGTIVAGGHG